MVHPPGRVSEPWARLILERGAPARSNG